MTFQSTEISISKLVAKETENPSGLSTSEFQALLGGGVLQELDAQIQIFKGEIQASNDMKARMREDISTLNSMIAIGNSNKGQNEIPITPSNGDTYVPEKGTYFTHTLANFEGLEQLAEDNGLIDEFRELSQADYDNADFYVDASFLGTLKETLENKIADLNSQSEMDMIKFQSLMDARKQTVMMLSNLMNGDHQTKMNILNNMKG